MTNSILRSALGFLLGNFNLRRGRARWGETPSSQVGSQPGHGSAEPCPTFALFLILFLSAALLGTATAADQAVAFDGVDDYVLIKDVNNGYFCTNTWMPTTEVTVEFWQKVSSVKFQATFGTSPDNTANHLFGGMLANGNVRWEFGDRIAGGLEYTPPPGSLVGSWNHFAMVSSVSGNFMRIYRNGVLEASRVGAGQFTPSPYDLLLGKIGNSLNFGGQLDEFRIWNYARSESQIRSSLALNRFQQNQYEPGLAAYFTMNPLGVGGSVTEDQTVNQSYGQLLNGAAFVNSTAPPYGIAFVSYNFNLSLGYYVAYEGYQPGINYVANAYFPTVVVSNLSYSIVTGGASSPGVQVTDGYLGLNLSLYYSGDTWTNQTSGNNSAGLRVKSAGPNGPGGTGDGGNASSGGPAGTATVNSTGTIITSGATSPGILAISEGGPGGNGASGADGGYGGWGGNGSNATIQGSGFISTSGSNSAGVLALSVGGAAGDGGNGAIAGGGSGGLGGEAGSAVVAGQWTISTSGNNSPGLSARSLGGTGGQGGRGGIFGGGAGGGASGSGSNAAVNFAGGTIDTYGADSHGIYAGSIGGFAGDGNASLLIGSAGDGGSAGNGGDVSVVNSGVIRTRGSNAHGIFAESVGGGGGAGGSSSILPLFSSTGLGAAGGGGGSVLVQNQNIIQTSGSFSRGIFAQSVGGGGGEGGTAGGLFYSVGGDGGKGGKGSNVAVINYGPITTGGSNASGIFAQSVGGGGGTGGGAVAVGVGGSLAIGGTGGGGGGGSSVYVSSSSLGSIATQGDNSHGIFAQSVGGGGGNGGFAISGDYNPGVSLAVAVGGKGGGGGSASNVSVLSFSPITTRGTNAHGIIAQSVGGGGGSGGFSIAVSTGLYAGALSLGGDGSAAGNGQTAYLQSTGVINTYGDRSFGLFAQSVGGGGGDGGFSIAGAFGAAAVPVTLGGSGSAGGYGNVVNLINSSPITTRGSNAHGIVAQSVGGGGGSGGFSIATSGGSAFAGSLSLGGPGSGGGSASNVFLSSSGAIITSNTHAYGILAQSVGGGGGDGGFSVAGAIAPGVALTVSHGGTGGAGGAGGAVSANNSGPILTKGELSHGLFAQSVGGGGGSGGFSVAASLTGTLGVGFSMGGHGGPGVGADRVDVNNSGTIETTSKGAHAIVAQSVGGGGGSGGFSGTLAGGFTSAANIGISVGGFAGNGGPAGPVSLTNSGGLLAHGDSSSGIYAQSVGGGGGDGGFSLAAAIGLSGAPVNASVSIGGWGGDGGLASTVNVVNHASIGTQGTNAPGIFAQSVGGGGGNGGFSVAGSLTTSTNAKQLAVSIGGHGGTGNHAAAVSVLNDNSLITTVGNDSPGIFAQSLGGGGGNGGFSVAGAISGGGTKNASVSVGGFGGGAGNGASVIVSNSSNSQIQTSGERAHGVFAQSIGGGGGNGGWSAAGDLAVGGSGKALNVAVSVGGFAGGGGYGSTVLVTGGGSIATTGVEAHGVFAQSVGGGGGNGGASLSATALLGPLGTNIAVSLALGGFGGSGNTGGTVSVNRAGTIETFNDDSHGILAQSVGGGGGTGGAARTVNLFLKPPGDNKYTNSNNKSLEFTMGGFGGDAGVGGSVGVTNLGNITTHGGNAHGIFAQSVGGGGGAGGNSYTGPGGLEIPGPVPLSLLVKPVKAKTKSLEIVAGGNGGTGNHGGKVSVQQSGNITTLWHGSYGILAQSIGAGGGAGGNGVVGLTGKIGIGGKSGASGNGGDVTVDYSGVLDTTGDGSFGIFAQSVGGGGGVAGDVVRGLKNQGLNVGANLAYSQGDEIYGSNSAGDGGKVSVNSTNSITTRGTGAAGIFAQSVGGGGGVAGNLGNDLPGIEYLNFSGSVGGVGSGGEVVVRHTGNITTLSNSAHGIFAQSVGGTNAAGATNGVGGRVEVVLNGNVTAAGADSDGIFVQSRGESGRGNIAVTVSGGQVQGGSGTGAGVRFFDGVTNTLTNQGTITSLGGTAILGNSGNETIHNYGTIRGLVNLGAGTNVFNNYGGATWSSGTVLLDQGLVLSNYGTVRATNGGTGVFDIRDGTNVFLAGLIEADRLFVTNSQGRFVFNGGTLITRGATISNGQDFVVGANAGAGSASGTFANSSPITINDNSAATPYPSSINVSSLGSIIKVTVTVANLNHTYPDDVDLLLVGPGGQKVMLMSSAGYSNPVVSVNLTFDDAAATPIPDGTQITSGTYQPANYSGANLPAPAPAGPYVASLSSLNGLNPNGTWSLFVNDHAGQDFGAISGGWSLNFTTAPATWDVRSNAAPTTVAGNLFIGQNTSNARLLVTNGGVVANSGFGFIGYTSGANSNVALVTGAGSRWTNSGDLYVGDNGNASGNRLVVSNGGVVANVNGYLSGNYDSSNNVALITGTNSRWNSSGNLLVGYFGNGNQLVVSNGGVVANDYGYLGYDPSASNNVALVTGAGSRWTNNSELKVGYSGSGNQLVVSNSGTVSAANVIVGYDTANSANNRVTVDGGNLFATNSGGTGALDIRRGTNVLNAGLIVADRLLLTNSAGFFNFNGGTLITRGGTVSNGQNFVVGASGTTAAILDVRSNTPLTLSSNFTLGANTAPAGNRLLITNGGTLSVANISSIGPSSASSNNVALVTGAGSLWTNGANLVVGNSGSGNQLVVSNGGVVASGFGRIGLNPAASNNVAVVTGAGSLWTINGSLRVGESGSGNQLVVSDGGTMRSFAGIVVGFSNNAANNRLTVQGGNLILTNAGGTAALDIRRGTNVLNAGLIVTDNLLLTNSGGFFDFNGGTLNVRSATVNNSVPFTVGNGTSNATYRLSGTAASVHSFANNLLISSNATLTGNGTIIGAVTNFGTVAPGNSAGSIKINGSLSLKSSSMMSFELGGLIATNDYDVVNVTNLVQFAGTLSLALLPNYLPAPANTFTLVSFGSASGSFANISSGRVSLTNNLASFAVTQTATNLVLGGVTYTDTDGDGQGDLQEQAAGTDPAVSASVLRIVSVTREGPVNLRVRFTVEPGKNHRIEWSSDLVTWNALTGPPTFTAGPPGTKEWLDDGSLAPGLNISTTRRFYRVGLQ